MYMKYFFLDLAKSCNAKCIQHKISKFYVHNMTIGLGQTLVTYVTYRYNQKLKQVQILK